MNKVLIELLKEIESTSKELTIYSSELVRNESMVKLLLEKLHNLDNAIFWYNKTK